MLGLIRNTATILLVSVSVALLIATQSVQAGERFKKEDVNKLAVAIVKAAHPTGAKPAVLKFSESELDGVLRLKLEIEYYGAASSNRYTADSLIQIQLPKKAGDPLEVKSIDFKDNNNSIKPNVKNLGKLKDEQNAKFRIESVK